MKKLIVALSAVTLLVAGCSGSDDKADPSPTAAATSSAEDQARQQAKEQAEQVKKTQEDLAKATAEEAAKAQGTVVKIEIRDGKVTPQGKRVEVKVGDKVTLVVTSDVDEEIHVHSDPEHTYEASPGKTLSETFTLKRPGQVAVEAHHLDVTIVQLVVRP